MMAEIKNLRSRREKTVDERAMLNEHGTMIVQHVTLTRKY